ncbi:MAG: response regulator [Chloroflexi bacterium]|nr:response regulator [Chloroflexota bacterium]
MSQIRILIIEDDEELRQIYRQALEREAYEIYEAADGTIAVDALESIQPHLIVLDMMMPNMRGPDVLEAIRQNPTLTDVRLVVITAYPQFRESALSYEVDQFLTKPVRPSEIVQAIKLALENG